MGRSIAQSTMSPNPNVIELYRGQSKTVELDITEFGLDVDKNTTIVPFDLTGCDIFLTVRVNGSAPKILIYKTTADALQIAIVTPFTAGKALIMFTPADTKYLEVDKYQYDVWVKKPSGELFPVVEVSDFIVLQPITVL